MNKKNDFALVPRAPTAIEKTEPGVRRVLSGMVTDTLALAKRNPSANLSQREHLRFVMMDDESHILKLIESVMRTRFSNATILTFTDAKLAYQELMREAPDLFITDVVHSPPNGIELLRLLTEKKVKYPILVMSGFAKEKDVLPHAGRELNVTFLAKPFLTDQLLTAVEAGLRILA